MFAFKAMFAAMALISTLTVRAAATPLVDIEERGNLTVRAESHRVNLVNRCGSGQAVFLYRDNGNPQGSTIINSALYGGVAWISGFSGANCLSSGVNCGIVEFTLINPGTDGANTQNSADYSLQSQGNHQFTYRMDFHYDGSCTNGAPGPCVAGNNCPGAFVGGDTASGRPVNCIGANTGITITFC